MASHTRLAILAFTVGTWLMVRETVAMETLARSATVRMSMRTGFFLAPRADLVFLVAMSSGPRMRLQNTLEFSEIKKQICSWRINKTTGSGAVEKRLTGIDLTHQMTHREACGSRLSWSG